jgi:hypothetical protein
VTPDEALSDALGTLESWLSGYTDPDEHGKQYRRSIESGTDSTLTVSYGDPYGGDEGRRTFRVSVTVEEVT